MCGVEMGYAGGARGSEVEALGGVHDELGVDR